MLIEMLKSKIHRAKVTARDINYEGSITIDKKLCDKAKINEFEKVDVYNINNGERFTTYVIYGKDGEIQINGAAARLCEKEDLIIASYCILDEKEAKKHKPIVIKL
ncbi:MAG TPA: aspartate 1-decarboxylase [Elusimicrobiales bacterium]|nr:aspartate 1-decarboxylase [Elusimicrobiales bacterium]HOL63359.1 aspartate 1-decarboxylase [Elusimicrobiales bacterium]